MMRTHPWRNDADRKSCLIKVTLLCCWLVVLLAHHGQCQGDYAEEIAASLAEAGNHWANDGAGEGDNSDLQGFGLSSGTNPKLTTLDVICGKEFMTVRAEFNAPFNGIVFSKGTYGQNKCVYVKPQSGLSHISFNVRYDGCGTKPDLQGKYFENTIVIQYGTDIIEALDEAKRLRCEWFEAYEKPATFRPAIPVADLDVIEMNFQGDDIDCWMSIQEGKGPWSNEINRIVTVGQPLTLVVAINDNKKEFDMKVKSCFAHDGSKAPIYLIDEDGCVLRPKMISPFKKIRNAKSKASLVSYAQFLAFKFPDSVDVQIQCTVEVCRHGCQDTCGTNYDPRAHQQRHQQPNRDQLPTPQMNTMKNINLQVNSVMNAADNAFFIENTDLLESADTNHVVKEMVPPPPPSTLSPSADESMHDNNPVEQDRFDLNKLQQQNNTLFTTTTPQMQSRPVQAHAKPNIPNIHLNKRPHDPVAQVMDIPLNPMFNAMGPIGQMPLGVFPPPPFMSPPPPSMPQHIQHNRPGKPTNFPSLLNPFSNIKLFNKNSRPSNLLSDYFGKNRRTQQVPVDHFDMLHHHPPQHHHHQPYMHPIRPGFRAKRFINEPQGEIGLKKGFQVVTSLDLSFSPNMSSDQMPIYEGKPAAIVYGICFSTSHFLYVIVSVLALLISAIASSVYIICKIEKTKRVN